MNDATITFRIPKELKTAWVQESRLLGMSIAELIRAKMKGEEPKQRKRKPPKPYERVKKVDRKLCERCQRFGVAVCAECKGA